MRCIDELHMQYPFAGSRMMRDLLNRQGHHIGRRHTRTLMKKMGIQALYCKPNLSQANQAHRKYGEFKHEVRQFEKSYDNQQAEQISLMV